MNSINFLNSSNTSLLPVCVESNYSNSSKNFSSTAPSYPDDFNGPGDSSAFGYTIRETVIPFFNLVDRFFKVISQNETPNALYETVQHIFNSAKNLCSQSSFPFSDKPMTPKKDDYLLTNFEFDPSSIEPIIIQTFPLTELHAFDAACKGDVEKLKECAKAGIDLYKPLSTNGWTLLHSAAYSGQLKTFKFLLESVPKDRRASFIYAQIQEQGKLGNMIETLSFGYFKPSWTRAIETVTAAHLAAVKGHFNILQYLLQKNYINLLTLKDNTNANIIHHVAKFIFNSSNYEEDKVSIENIQKILEMIYSQEKLRFMFLEHDNFGNFPLHYIASKMLSFETESASPISIEHPVYTFYESKDNHHIVNKAGLTFQEEIERRNTPNIETKGKSKTQILQDLDNEDVHTCQFTVKTLKIGKSLKETASEENNPSSASAAQELEETEDENSQTK